MSLHGKLLNIGW